MRIVVRLAVMAFTLIVLGATLRVCEEIGLCCEW